MKPQTPAARHVSRRPVLRYFYPQSRPTNGMTRLMFVYKKKNLQGTVHSINFQTGISVEPANWCKVTKTVTPAESNYRQLNSQLDDMHALALMAIDEGKTQDELRALLDLNDTRLVKPYQRTTTHRPQGVTRAVGTRTALTSPTPAELVNTTPKHPGISSPAEEGTVTSFDTRVRPSESYQLPSSLNRTPKQSQEPVHPDSGGGFRLGTPTVPPVTNVASDADEKPVEVVDVHVGEHYLVGDRQFPTQQAAVLAAWELATISDAHIPIYRVQTELLGAINLYLR